MARSFGGVERQSTRWDAIGYNCHVVFPQTFPGLVGRQGAAWHPAHDIWLLPIHHGNFLLIRIRVGEGGELTGMAVARRGGYVPSCITMFYTDRCDSSLEQ